MASSFDCFENEFPALAKLGKLAETYCYSDPNSALYKIRKIGETITSLVYEYDDLPVPTGTVYLFWLSFRDKLQKDSK